MNIGTKEKQDEQWECDDKGSNEAIIRARLLLKRAYDGGKRGAAMVRCSKVMVVDGYDGHVRDGIGRTTAIPTGVGGGRRGTKRRSWLRRRIRQGV